MTAPEDRPDERAADWERQADEHYAALVATQSRLADAVEFNRANQARADRAEMHADGLRKSLRSAEARLEAVKAALESSTRRFKLSGLSADGFGIHAAVAAALSVAPQPQPDVWVWGDPESGDWYRYEPHPYKNAHRPGTNECWCGLGPKADLHRNPASLKQQR